MEMDHSHSKGHVFLVYEEKSRERVAVLSQLLIIKSSRKQG